ncbi:hypothetical protein ACFPES_22565 [Paenibacillus sp. GCM10023248]|uniref:hypothetical protein n=1 Tax=Bacillales TaxID=1385 RepID=UPI0023797079|nr:MULTISPECIES: hypothetical protein [Bacillales]MDD9269841.1 hypothetical protein [Paenibacillus sp. MAHUQ-63]MDR6881746.1 hypothetical protein [Bacillus sp. 3255]
MKGRRRIKRTTLLIIGAVLLWGAVAIWNEVLKIEKGSTIPRSTSASHPQTDKSNQTSIISETNGNKLTVK